MLRTNTSKLLIGGDVLNLITSGMYDNPLAIYREYIQNSADAFSTVDRFGNSDNRKITIEIDPAALLVKIQDNGPGLSYEDAIRALVPIARSQKKRESSRGFRGIGRLSGLAFAESVTFLTRAQGNLPVTSVNWNGAKLRNRILETSDTEQAIRDCVGIHTLRGIQFPDNFFEVEVKGVARHAAGLILNREAVRSYISEVCPVPMSFSFPFASRISELSNEYSWLYALDVFLDDDPERVVRKHNGTIRFSDKRYDRFSELEEFRIQSVDSDRIAAVGWVAHSSYLGAIPKEAGVRGIRAREGNIQIGDETVFDHLFPEERFNRWCVGEVHILDHRIVPNGRRDYFEPGPHTRNLENHLIAIVRRIIKRCRQTSIIRNRERKLSSILRQFEETYDLAVSGYLFPEDAKALVQSTLGQIQDIRRENCVAIDSLGGDITKLDELESRLSNFRVKRGRPSINGIPKEEVATYRQVFKALIEVLPSTQVAKKAIETVLTHALLISNMPRHRSRE